MATFIARLRQSWEEELRQKATQDAGRRPNDDGRRRVRLDFVGFAQRCFCELKPSRARSTGADPLRHPLVFGRPSVASVARGSGARRQIVARLPADHRQRLVPPDLSDPPLARTAGGAGVRGDGAGAAGSRPRSAGADRAPSRLDHHRRSVEAGGGLVRGPAGRRQRVVRPYALPAAERQAAECDRDDHHRLHESLSSGVTRGTISWAGGWEVVCLPAIAEEDETQLVDTVWDRYSCPGIRARHCNRRASRCRCLTRSAAPSANIISPATTIRWRRHWVAAWPARKHRPTAQIAPNRHSPCHKARSS